MSGFWQGPDARGGFGVRHDLGTKNPIEAKLGTVAMPPGTRI
jgi:hypothetical protein